jgi:hypothetical protein
VLRLSEWARKLTILIFGITILGVNVKNSVECFTVIAQQLDSLPVRYQIGGQGAFSSVVHISVIAARICDIIVALIYIYFFTRPNVKRQFQGH